VTLQGVMLHALMLNDIFWDKNNTMDYNVLSSKDIIYAKELMF
jgi:hypothetical protein